MLSHSTTIKLARTNTSLISTTIAHLLRALLNSLFQKPPKLSPNSLMMLPLLPFLSATSIALLKPGIFMKLQKPLQNAVRHKQAQTSEDRQNYIAISRYICTVVSKAKAESWLALTFFLKPVPVKSFLSTPLPLRFLFFTFIQFPKMSYPRRLCKSTFRTSTISFLYPNPKILLQFRKKPNKRN